MRWQELLLLALCTLLLSNQIDRRTTREEARQIAVEAACRAMVEAKVITTCTVERK